MKVEEITYGGWEKCIRLSNGIVDLVAPTRIGLRITRFGLMGGSNQFFENPADLGAVGGDGWRIYGGHRLWYAPENPATSLLPDNQPVDAAATPEQLLLTQQIETSTGLQKQMQIQLVDGAARAKIVHSLKNYGSRVWNLAPWALTVMAGGTAILPLPEKGTHPRDLLPNGSLILWPYTDLTDSRYRLGRNYLRVIHDPHNKTSQKIGSSCPAGWLGCYQPGGVFIKHTQIRKNGVYPDLGSVVEVYCDSRILELETLGPLVKLEPGEKVELSETWELITGISDLQTEDDIDQQVLPHITSLDS